MSAQAASAEGAEPRGCFHASPQGAKACGDAYEIDSPHQNRYLSTKNKQHLRLLSFDNLKETTLSSMATKQLQREKVIGPPGYKRKCKDSWRSTMYGTRLSYKEKPEAYALILRYPKGILNINLKGILRRYLELLTYHHVILSQLFKAVLFLSVILLTYKRVIKDSVRSVWESKIPEHWDKGILNINLVVFLKMIVKHVVKIWARRTPRPKTFNGGGVAQLQAAMLKQMSADKSGERTPETVKPGTSTLPVLPPVRSESSSVDLLDWLELIESPMSDLSDGSASWWKQVRASSKEAYDLWVVSGPIERLGVVPASGGELEEGKWPRVNSRAASMILTALDESIRFLTQAYLFEDFMLLFVEYLTRTVDDRNHYNPTYSTGAKAEADEDGGEEERDKRKETPCKFFGKTYKGNTRRRIWNTRSKGATIDTEAAILNLFYYNEVLSDVGKILKAMHASSIKKFAVNGKEETQSVEPQPEPEVPPDQPKVAALEVSEDEGGTGLLDSGASHPMRPAKGEEYQRGEPVRVTLAGEDVRVLRQNPQGTILVQEEETQVQPIVPLGAVIENLGYTLHWSPRNLRLTHPSRRSVKVKIKNHCPEVAACDALNLIQELEMSQVRDLNTHVESLRARLEVMKKEEKRDWTELMREFSRTGSRATLLRTLLLCPFTKDLPADVQSLLIAFVGSVYGKDFGCVGDSSMWILAQLSCAEERTELLSGEINEGNVGFLMDFPSDEERLRDDDPVRASPWETELWKSFKSIAGMTKVSFYMGAYGHKAKRPTTMATTYPSLCQIDNIYDFHDGCVPPSLLSHEEMRNWSYPFKAMVANAVCDYQVDRQCNEEELAELGVKLTKLTKEQRESWQRHLLNDHQPYRADCAVCINAQATGYQHRRRRHPSMYTVALDLAGPFKQKGRDMDHEDYKYLMVAAYRCPKEYLNEKALAYLDSELYVPDEPEECGGDDPMALSEEEVEKEAESEEERGEPCGPETLDDAVEGLLEQEEWTTIYVTRPMRRRTTQYAAQAAKEIVLQLRQSGLHVSTVHTDRAREFKAKLFKDWTVEAQLRHTKTAGGDPAGNSSAELGIKWAKARVRALLVAAKAPPRDWPMAISHASLDLWAKAFPDSPWSSPPATAFGSEVWFRAKYYQGKSEKKHEAAGMRWKRGWYRGPAMDVKRGHLIVREDGGLTVAKSVKLNVWDPTKEMKDLVPPSVADGLPDELLISPEPPTKGELRDEVEFRSRMLLEEENFDINKAAELFKTLEIMGDTDQRIKAKSPFSSWYTGAFVHGGVAGIRNNLKEFPYTTKYLVGVAKKCCGDVKFSAIGLAKNAQLGLHRDSHNYKHSKNYVIPLQAFEKGSLWVQNENDEDREGEERTLSNGKVVYGKLHEMHKGIPVCFSPRLWHEVQPWEGERMVLLLYTPRATRLPSENVESLEEAGFPVDRDSLLPDGEEEGDEEKIAEFPIPLPAAKVKMMKAEENVDGAVAFVELENNELLKGESGDNSLQLPPGDPPNAALHDMVHVKKMIKKAEVQYTPNIEQILEDIEAKGGQLEVTHTVSLADVKSNLEKWKQSALKEFNNLTKSKQAFKVMKRHELPANCRIVPCKGVYTVKPDKGPPGYRRKTRFVACGNYISEESATMDLFAAGLDATSLRTMLAYNAKKPWRIGTTDVRQAFVLARWRGEPVALEPPGIAYLLGLAVPGDVWFVQQALYGLRESPALWSMFRDEQLKLARWIVNINGQEVKMKLEQLVSDNQVWKIIPEHGGEVYGYVLVYIDDLLIHAQEEAMEGFFKWVSAKWEVDDLDVLDYNHPIRFLGMELHKVQGGVELAQEGFVNEILRSYHHEGGRSYSQGPRETLLLTEEEERALIDAEPSNVDPKDPEVKEAQKRVGELLWLVGRTRPDIQHTVSIMASRITRSPGMVNVVGRRLLDYLSETKYYRLSFTQDEEESVEAVSVYTDSSFSPSGGRSHGAVAIFYGNNPLSWRASRQPLTTLSTAESELVEAVEGTLMGCCCSPDYIIRELENKVSTNGQIWEPSPLPKNVYGNWAHGYSVYFSYVKFVEHGMFSDAQMFTLGMPTRSSTWRFGLFIYYTCGWSLEEITYISSGSAGVYGMLDMCKGSSSARAESVMSTTS
ncbi:RE1 [Symbiodinium sp. CCMP2592]|nr:RE1 [Symbiodinium sp. CCMP2592]